MTFPNRFAQGWSADGRVHWNQRDADTKIHAYSSDPDGGNVRPWGSWPKRHAGLGNTTADGKLAALTIERASHPNLLGNDAAAPGRGVFADVYLTDGITSWQLTGLTGQPDSGKAVFWPMLSPDGKQLMWTNLLTSSSWSEFFGTGEIRIADVVWTDGVPSLTNLQHVAPEAGRFYETYGWMPNGRILFASDMGQQDIFNADWLHAQIWTAAPDGSGYQMMSDPITAKLGSGKGYNEFAAPLPDGSVVFCREYGALNGGMNHWVRQPDGTLYQLTARDDPTTPMATSFAIAPDGSGLLATYAPPNGGAGDRQCVLYRLDAA